MHNFFNWIHKNLSFVRSIDSAEQSRQLNLIWNDDFHFEINNIKFKLSIDTKVLQGPPLKNIFLLGKNKKLIEEVLSFIDQNKIKKIFEMGILHGGSTVMYDQIFALKKIVAVDHNPQPVIGLMAYIKESRKAKIVKPYYGVNQADSSAMKKILSQEFPKSDIDLIIDDASHFYQETKDAFNISFPYLKADGFYIIEDWAWAHWPESYFQNEENPALKGKVALSNFLIELFMLAASKPDYIQNIFITSSMLIIKKGDGRLAKKNFNISDYYLLRGKLFQPWL